MLDTPNSGKPLQRAHGRADVVFGATGLRHLHQSGCAKALLPRNFQPTPEAVFLNTSGGVTGGDQLEYSAKVEADTALCVTTQAAERIYKSCSGAAKITNMLTLEANSRLEWLPQETILFEGSVLKRQLNVEMADTAHLLAVETLVLGRRAMGETLREASISDQWRVRRGGRLVFADALRFGSPTTKTLSTTATLNGNRALSTILYIAPDAEARIDHARSLLKFEGVEAGASAWNGMLSVRFLAPDAQPLRAALVAFLTQFRGCELPRIWHM